MHFEYRRTNWGVVQFGIVETKIARIIETRKADSLNDICTINETLNKISCLYTPFMLKDIREIYL